MCTRATLAEVRELQKAAGILNENDIDYSLDEMLDEEGMLNERKTPPCGYIIMAGGSMIGQRHDLTKFFDSEGHYGCFDLQAAPNSRADLRGWRQATSDETDWSMPRQQQYSAGESVQEDVVPKPTGPAACPPGYTSYATGLDTNGVACIRGNQAPKSINGKPPKKVASTTAPKPGAPAPLKEKMQTLPGCGPMWDGQKAVEGVRWMLDRDPLKRSTCLLPGRQPDFKVDGFSLIPYTNQESVQEAVGSVAPCGPGFTAYATGPKPQDLICMPSNQTQPKNINGKPPQKKAGSPAAPTAPKPGMQPQI